jgi:hypothetical protein
MMARRDKELSMKTWQAASIGLVLGVAATAGIGAIGHSDQPVGPYFQVNSQEIVNTSHIQTASLAKEVQLYGTATKKPEQLMIILTFENGKNETLLFDTNDEAQGAWRKLRVLLGVEMVVPAEK